ncbi:MAG: L-threonylcarbamoyladenylate synthase [Actinomycetota bacterium]|nr:L-threonylcarbamoyladenylate synthase [Actinomycetota bacterium]
MSTVDEAVAAIRAGELAIVPTDTVYGLAASPHSEAHVRRLYRAKGRDEPQPTALVAADVDTLLECVPELRGRAEAIARALLPGAFTLVLPNPARLLPWLTGSRPETIGVRVPAVDGIARELLERVGVVAATSANLPGGADPRTLAEVPEALRAHVAALVDGGELPGTPSTVIDFTGAEPTVLREGGVAAEVALARARAAL